MYASASSVLVKPPGGEPVSLGEAKDHVGATHDGHDAVLESLVAAARRRVEEHLGRALLTQTRRLSLDHFPWEHGGEIRLPRPPLQRVVKVEFVDPAGATAVLPAADYQVDTDAEPGRLLPAYGKRWPAARHVPGGVRITYVAGYGSEATDVPEDIRHLIKLLVGLWYQNPEPVVTGTIATSIPLTFEWLAAPYRIWSFG